jgi:hypothetical protein
MRCGKHIGGLVGVIWIEKKHERVPDEQSKRRIYMPTGKQGRES